MMRPLFDVFAKTCVNGIVDVVKYRAQRSALTVTIANVESPIVKGYFCFATETDSEDGLPHTLEHLVFLGSRNYRCKGLLDEVANLCLADGTNAWTSQDMTNYTVSTAGSCGFLKLLPIYLDHVLQPLLTEAGYVTEVHHVTGDGDDAGVVYSEMQHYESDMSSITERRVRQLLYPSGSGYAVVTGGRVPDIRQQCSHQRVVDYHKRFYHPANVRAAWCRTGCVEHEDILRAVEQVETALLARADVREAMRSFVRPFRSAIARPSKSLVETIVCPSEDESTGIVRVACLGPSSLDVYESTALSVLLEYLSSTAVAPLERDFVQLADPFCTSVSASIDEQFVSHVELKFSGVPTKKLNEIAPRLNECLERIARADEPIDMVRLRNNIVQSGLRSLIRLETDPHDTIAEAVEEDFLFGDTPDDFAERLSDAALFKRLEKEPHDFWLALMKKYLEQANNPSVCVVGVPSAAAVAECAAEERRRVAAQRERLGERGLADCAARLQKATDETDADDVDDDVRDDCVVRSLDGIRPAVVSAASNLDAAAAVFADLPFSFMADSCPSNFVSLTALLDTTGLGASDRSLIMLWRHLLFESPMMVQGELVPYEDIVKDLNRDLVAYDADIGIHGKFERVVCVSLRVAAESVEKGVDWLQRFLTNVVFTEERVRVVAQRLATNAVTYRRDGDTVSDFLLRHATYERDSNPHLHSILRLDRFHDNVVKRLDDDAETVIAALAGLQAEMATQRRIAVHVCADAARLTETASLLRESLAPLGAAPRVDSRPAAEPRFVGAFGRALAAGVGSYESASVQLACAGPQRCDDARLPALLAFVQLLTQCEGPLWKRIRGRGLAYGADLSVSADTGLIKLSLYRSSQPVEAFGETLQLITSYLDGSEEMDEQQFEAAKRSLIFEIVRREETRANASVQSLLSYYRRVPQSYNQDLCKRVWDLEMGDLLQTSKSILQPMFSSETSNLAVVCHPSKLHELTEGFAKLGRQLTIVELDDPELSYQL